MSTVGLFAGAYHGVVSSNPPTEEPEERWQQPSFGPQPPPQGPDYPLYGAPLPASRPFYPPARQVPPPSTLETVVGAVSRVIWPVAILLFITTHMGFFPLIVIAIVANMVLGSIRRSLRQRRFAALPPDPPTYPSAPSQPDDLR